MFEGEGMISSWKRSYCQNSTRLLSQWVTVCFIVYLAYFCPKLITAGLFLEAKSKVTGLIFSPHYECLLVRGEGGGRGGGKGGKGEGGGEGEVECKHVHVHVNIKHIDMCN